MAHRAVKGATYTTLVSSSLVLAIVDSACAIALFAWALTQGVFPSLDALPSLPSFDFAWFLDHPQVSQVLLVIARLRPHRARDLDPEQRRGVPQPRRPGVHHPPHPTRWLRTVVVWQLADWALRLTTIWFMLAAFGINQSLRNVLLVQASQSLATLVPVSPGGVGTEQAFLVYTLRGQAPRSALLAFSVGMRLTLTAVNVVLGFTAILLTFRTVRFRKATAGAEPGPPRSGLRRCAGPPVRWSWPNTDRAVFAGRPGHALELLLRRGEEAVGRAEVLQDRPPARRADAVERVEDRLERARVALLPVERDREPVRLVADPLEQLQPRVVRGRAGSARDRPGTNTSSSRFASAITATRGSPAVACIASSAAASCPLPPSMTTRFGTVAKLSSYGRRRRVAQPREAAGDHLRPSTRSRPGRPSPRTRERAVVRLLRLARRRTPPSRRRCRGPAGSRCRSTRSAPAGSRG